MAKYKCENKECKKSFTTNRGLASHKRMHKADDSIKEYWGDYKNDRSVKKQNNAEYSKQLLRDNGIKYVEKNNGVQLLVEDLYNFYPTTGKILTKNMKSVGRGVNTLIGLVTLAKDKTDLNVEVPEGWSKHWRSDKGVMEDICKHGVGHEEGIHGCDGCCGELHRDKVQLGVELPEISEELNDTLNLIDNLMSDVAKQHSIQVQTRLEVYIKPRAWYIPEWLYNLVIKKHVQVTDHGTTVQLKENK